MEGHKISSDPNIKLIEILTLEKSVLEKYMKELSQALDTYSLSRHWFICTFKHYKFGDRM